MRQISEQSVRNGGELPCEGGWSRQREMLAGRQERRAVSSLQVWFLLASGRLEMTGEIVTVEFAGQRPDSIAITEAGYTAGMT